MEATRIHISSLIDARRMDPIFFRYGTNRFGQKFTLVSIGAVSLDLQSGFGAGKGDQSDESNGTLHLRPTNIDNEGNLVFEKNIYVPSYLNKAFIDKDDVLFNNTNSQELVGKTAILKDERKSFFSNHITKIRVNRKVIIPDYLWIILNVYQREKIFFSICTNWNNQSGVGIELLKSLKIPLPPIDIQKEIVELYTKAQQLKKVKEKEAKSLLESIDNYLFNKLGISPPQTPIRVLYFTVNISNILGERIDPHQFNAERMNMIQNIYFTNKWRKLKEVVRDVKSITKTFSNGDVYVGLENIESNTGEYIATSDKESISSAAVFKKGHILFPKLRPYLNKVYRAEFDGMCSTEFHVYEAKNIDADYLSNVLRSSMIVAQTKHLMTGNTLPRLQTKDVENLIIPFPSNEEQRDIVEFINKTRIRAQSLKKEGIALLTRAISQIERLILE